MTEQIKVMALDICKSRGVACVDDCEKCHMSQNCLYQEIALGLCRADYSKQRDGKWKKRIFIVFDSEKIGYRCSECNTTWDTDTNYCPNCGAKMKGATDEK